MFTLANSPIYCINLQYRRDRALDMMKQFNGEPFTFVNGCDKSDHPLPELSRKKGQKNAHGIYCCAKSHVALITRAWVSSQYFIVLEDDVTLCDDFYERLRLIEKEEIDFDLCYIGGHFVDKETDVTQTESKYLWLANNISGTYGYIINGASEAAQFIFRNWTYDWGIDEFFATHILPKFKCYAFLPFLVGHNKGYSDVNGWEVTVDYNANFQKDRL